MTSPAASARKRADDVPAPAQGSAVHVLGNLITFVLRGEDTGMAFSLAASRTSSATSAPRRRGC
jgi:hypothetical protein